MMLDHHQQTKNLLVSYNPKAMGSSKDCLDSPSPTGEG